MMTTLSHIAVIGLYVWSLLHFIFGTVSDGFLAFIAATAFRIAIAVEDK